MPGVTDKKESRGSGTYFPEVGAVEEEWHVCVCLCVCVCVCVCVWREGMERSQYVIVSILLTFNFIT
jgi:hypothetical protein